MQQIIAHRFLNVFIRLDYKTFNVFDQNSNFGTNISLSFIKHIELGQTFCYE